MDLEPQVGHEQAGYRTAVAISNDFFNAKVNLTIVCPITNTKRVFPLHIPLDNRTITTGFVLCEHIKALDLNAREHKVIERIPDDLLEEVIAAVFSQIAR